MNVKLHHRRILYLFALYLGCVFLLSCSTSSQNLAGEQDRPTLEGRTLVDSDEIPLLDSPTLGDVNAPLVVVEFLRLPCPDCPVPTEALAELVESRQDVQIVAKHNPRDDQPQSWIAARGLEAARETGAFWEFRQALLESQAELTPGNARAFIFGIAEELELDMPAFRRAFESIENTARIERDQKLARDLEIQATPAYAVQGHLLVGPRRTRNFVALFDETLLLIGELDAQGISAEEHYSRIVEARRQAYRENRLIREEDAIVRDVDPSRLAVLVTENDIIYGATEDYLITLVEFSHLQCPYGADAAETMEILAERFDNKIRFVFKHFPLETYPHGEDAGAALIAAHQQGLGPEMLRAIYARQRLLGEADFLPGLAAFFELDVDQFQEHFSSRATRDKVWDDYEEGRSLGVVSTPEFFINGIRVSGAHSVEYFESIIEAELQRARALQEEEGLQGEALYRALLERDEENQ